MNVWGGIETLKNGLLWVIVLCLGKFGDEKNRVVWEEE